jgi:hypothetical protein
LRYPALFEVPVQDFAERLQLSYDLLAECLAALLRVAAHLGEPALVLLRQCLDVEDDAVELFRLRGAETPDIAAERLGEPRHHCLHLLSKVARLGSGFLAAAA